jgi:hypothetical protein
MLYQCAEINVGSKTLNMVGGGGINSPHPPTRRYRQCSAHGCTGQSGAPTVRHRCANGRLQRLVLTASRWADGTPDSEQSLSGAPLKFHSRTLRSRISAWGNPSPGRGRTGQSGTPKSETLFSIFCCFSNRFSF